MEGVFPALSRIPVVPALPRILAIPVVPALPRIPIIRVVPAPPRIPVMLVVLALAVIPDIRRLSAIKKRLCVLEKKIRAGGAASRF